MKFSILTSRLLLLSHTGSDKFVLKRQMKSQIQINGRRTFLQVQFFVTYIFECSDCGNAHIEMLIFQHFST